MPQRLRSGFTLIEIAIAVVIVAVLATLAIPLFQRIQNQSLSQRLAHDLRVISNAFAIYEMEEGTWPAPAPAGTMPEGMAGFLPRSYDEGVQGRGDWVWSVDASGVGILSFEGSSLPIAVLAIVDKTLDDGDVSEGRLVVSGQDFSFRLE